METFSLWDRGILKILEAEKSELLAPVLDEVKAPRHAGVTAPARRIVTRVSSRDERNVVTMSREELRQLRKFQRTKGRMIDGFLYWTYANRGEVFFRFLTLTSAVKRDRHYLRKKFEAFKKRVKRAFGPDFQYLKVRTDEGNGVIHIVYVGPYLPVDWIRSTWWELTGAFEVKIYLIRLWKRRGLARTARYLAKNAVGRYMAENSGERGESRMSTSRGWLPRSEYETETTQIVTNDANGTKILKFETKRCIKRGVRVLREHLKRFNTSHVFLMNMAARERAGLSLDQLRMISLTFNEFWYNHFEQLINAKYPEQYWALTHGWKKSEWSKKMVSSPAGTNLGRGGPSPHTT